MSEAYILQESPGDTARTEHSEAGEDQDMSYVSVTLPLDVVAGMAHCSALVCNDGKSSVH